MNLKREQEFVSQYHFDARNFEWENENGAPETKVCAGLVLSVSCET